MAKPLLFQHPELDGAPFYWKKGSTAVLCLHGFTATTVEVRKIAMYIGSKGFTTAGPLLPGHGTDPIRLNKVSWMDWADEAEKQYLELRTVHDKIFVLGESMGGLLALYLMYLHPEIIGGMLFAPALRIPNLGISKYIWPFKNYIYKKNTDETMLWQGYNVVPLKAAASLVEFQHLIKKILPEIHNPVIIFQGAKDLTIDPMSSARVLNTISSVQKELVWLKGSGHVILLDKQLPAVQGLCIKFIETMLHCDSLRR